MPPCRPYGWTAKPRPCSEEFHTSVPHSDGRTLPTPNLRMIYLDHAATTPLAPEALDTMLPFLGSRFGNPSSIHAIGREARAAMDDARDTIAAAIHADYGEIYFTSSGTEADNLA